MNFVKIALVSSLFFRVTACFSQPAEALTFDGINDYVSLPHNDVLKPYSEITIEAWVKAIDIHINAFSEIYRKEDGSKRHLFSFQGNGRIISFGIEVAGVYSELDVPISPADFESQWVHLAATFDGSTKRIYRNATLIGAQHVTGFIKIGGTSPGIIGALGGTQEFLKGSMDEFRLWNRALPANEIRKNMNCQLSLPQSGLT